MSTSYYYKNIQCATRGPTSIIEEPLSKRPIYIQRDPETPLCHSCNIPIDGNLVKALGKTWHPEHFCCSYCGQVLHSPKFHVYRGLPYCPEDYATLCLKRCSGCDLPIEDVVVMGLGKPWHRKHFVCILCGVPLLNRGGYYGKEDAAYCTECYQRVFLPKSEISPAQSTQLDDEIFDRQLSDEFRFLATSDDDDGEMYRPSVLIGNIKAEVLDEDEVSMAKSDADGTGVWYFGHYNE
ncbi:hypothetical protein WDU94_007593 [Cyamophila willieti]